MLCFSSAREVHARSPKTKRVYSCLHIVHTAAVIPFGHVIAVVCLCLAYNGNGTSTCASDHTGVMAGVLVGVSTTSIYPSLSIYYVSTIYLSAYPTNYLSVYLRMSVLRTDLIYLSYLRIFYIHYLTISISVYISLSNSLIYLCIYLIYQSAYSYGTPLWFILDLLA